MEIRNNRLLIGALALSLIGGIVGISRPASGFPDDKQTAPHPPPDNPNVEVLFSGKEEEMKANFVKQGSKEPANWKIVDGAMVVSAGNILTKQNYGDCQLHVEFRTPDMPNAKGQAKGNSGIGLQGIYEVQVLDSYGIKIPGKGDAGSVYNQAAPLINASKPAREWQSFDITFRAARFANGQRTQKARVTVFHNGVCVQNNTEIEGPTGIGGNPPENTPSGIHFQDHGNPVEYRNIWVLPLPEKGSDKYEAQ
jgi:hypothetical protein